MVVKGLKKREVPALDDAFVQDLGGEAKTVADLRAKIRDDLTQQRKQKAENDQREAVLTTEVIPWARGAVREIDIPRRLMHHAVTHRTLPKGVDDRLVTIKDPRILAYSEAELRELQSQVKDANFRIFADGEAITVFNNELFVRGTDIQEIFGRLGVDEATHAFYLGRELMKAKLALTLGKTYRQEGALAWGYLTPPDDPRSEHAKLTQRSRRRPAASKGPE